MEANVVWQSYCFFVLALLCVLPFSRDLIYIFWDYCICNALWFLFRPFESLLIHPIARDKLEACAGQALAMLLIIPTFFVQVSLPWIHWAVRIFLILGAVDCAMLWFLPTGFLWAHTFDGAYLAMLLPLSPWWLACLFIVTILKTKSFTAVTVISAQILVRLRGLRLVLALANILAAIGLFWSLRGDMAFFFGFERMRKWGEFYAEWRGAGRQIFGTGAGSYFWLSPLAGGYRAPIYLQAHSDYLQTAFEFGWTGLAALLVSCGALWRQASVRGRTLLAGVMACMLTYYPLHHAFTACFCALVARLCIEGEAYENFTGGEQ